MSSDRLSVGIFAQNPYVAAVEYTESQTGKQHNMDILRMIC